jgi:ubiquinone/menaquinone biosynthesis C-methylase UbiE
MSIPSKLLPLLCDPQDHGPLAFEEGSLINAGTGRKYFVADGIPVLVDKADIGPQNVRIQDMYRWMAGGFDAADWIGNAITLGMITRFRRRFAGELRLKPGDRCLYTSIGTGLDLPFLAARIPLTDIELVGLDLSMEMLRQCQRKIDRRWTGPMLVQANAESLPFADRTFDTVFHLGGINLFDRPAAAVREMLRVAKPGALIAIFDESPECIRTQYQKWNPFTRKACAGISTDFDPRDWTPPEAVETEFESLHGGKGYFLKFRAP